jgi:hypothetical protein
LAVLFYMPTSNAQGFQFLHVLTNTCHSVFVFFDFWNNNQPNGRGWSSISLWLWLPFPNGL